MTSTNVVSIFEFPLHNNTPIRVDTSNMNSNCATVVGGISHAPSIASRASRHPLKTRLRPINNALAALLGRQSLT